METFEKLEKKYGRDDLVVLASKVGNEPIQAYSTGAMSLDLALGVGGIPGARATELFGPPGGGKSTVALCTIAELHKADSEACAAYIDLENALDLTYAAHCGVDLNRLYTSYPEWAEQAFDVAETLIRSGSVHVVVIDSVSALSPRAEMEGEMGDAHIGLLPRLISQFLRRTAFAMRESGVAVIFINQIRDKISKMSFGGKTQPGGWALKHYCSARVYLRSAGEVRDTNDSIMGSTTAFKVEKNKVGTAFKVGEFQIWGDRGICREASLLDMAVSKGIIDKRGSWYVLDDNTIAQGEVATIKKLTEDSKLFNTVKERLVSNEESP